MYDADAFVNIKSELTFLNAWKWLILVFYYILHITFYKLCRKCNIKYNFFIYDNVPWIPFLRLLYIILFKFFLFDFGFIFLLFIWCVYLKSLLLLNLIRRLIFDFLFAYILWLILFYFYILLWIFFVQIICNSKNFLLLLYLIIII